MNAMNRQILHGDALDKLKDIEDNSIDLITTDPPYGYSFMNKDWDKALISVEIWKECLRVLKPGAWMYVMSAPRQDVLSHMIVNLSNAGFVTNFTSIYWAYASGFPKAANISKMVDKKNKNDRIIIGEKSHPRYQSKSTGFKTSKINVTGHDDGTTLGTFTPGQIKETIGGSEQSRKLDGSYAGFQPKPAVEVILVCMKPLSEKNYVEQAMSNGKGVTWFDDVRIPFVEDENIGWAKVGHKGTPLSPKNGWNQHNMKLLPFNPSTGRFPANLLASDDALNDGKITKSNSGGIRHAGTELGQSSDWNNHENKDTIKNEIHDSGSFSRYFDLDKWEAQFIITPKANKSEKNKGLDKFTEKKVNDGRNIPPDNAFQRGKTERKNTHPTVKPVSLFKYLITMGSRVGDLILDPFMGSGTTAIAAEQTARDWIGIEKIPEYVEIFKARLADYRRQNKLEEFL